MGTTKSVSRAQGLYDYVALVGAFERDNFGDLLFLLVTERLLAPWPTVALGLLSADLSKQCDRQIISTSSWFQVSQNCLPRAIVFAGGETLTCDIDAAMRYSADMVSCRQGGDDHIAAVYRLMCPLGGRLPYVDGSQWRIDEDKRLVRLAYNSIGGAALDKSYNASIRDDIELALTDVDYLSVRDGYTQYLLSERLGIKAECHPDVVTLVSECCMEEIAKGKRGLEDVLGKLEKYILFQASDAYIENAGVPDICDVLAESSKVLSSSVMLQPAGLAQGHDSIDKLAAIRGGLYGRGMSADSVYLHENRSVWAQVAAIANAACFVGTSLHGRIVSMSFGVPRVSLKQKAKIGAYVKTWDIEGLPFDVELNGLVKSITEALEVESDVLIAHSEMLKKKATIGINELIKALDLNGEMPKQKGIARELNRLKLGALMVEVDYLRKGLKSLAEEFYFKEKMEAERAKKPGLEQWSLSSKVRKKLQRVRKYIKR